MDINKRKVYAIQNCILGFNVIIVLLVALSERLYSSYDIDVYSFINSDLGTVFAIILTVVDFTWLIYVLHLVQIRKTFVEAEGYIYEEEKWDEDLETYDEVVEKTGKPGLKGDLVRNRLDTLENTYISTNIEKKPQLDGEVFYIRDKRTDGTVRCANCDMKNDSSNKICFLCGKELISWRI